MAESSNALWQDIAAILHTREQEYGKSEQNFNDIATMWSVLLGIKITPEQVAYCMIAFKLVRLKNNPSHTDSQHDVIGYAALATQLKEQ